MSPVLARRPSRTPVGSAGFQPDACFYVHYAAAIRGKDRIDPRLDPPPDVVVEIDITRSSIDKLPLDAQFGVLEVWRHDGEAATILLLEDGGYVEGDSRVFPGLDAGAFTRLLAAGQRTPVTRWLPEVRAWASTASAQLVAHGDCEASLPGTPAGAATGSPTSAAC